MAEFLLELNEASTRKLKSELRSMFEELDRNSFDRIVNSFVRDDNLGEYESICRKKRAHPLALHWANLEHEICSSLKNKKLSFSYETWQFIDRLISLNRAKVKNKEKIISGIMNSGTFHSSMFESFVAARYSGQGYEVEAILERPKESQKTPDLCIKDDQNLLFVECKSLEKTHINERYTWELLFFKIKNLINKSEWCYHISFICDGPTNPQIIETLPEKLQLLCQRNKSFYNVQISEGIYVTGKRIVRRGVSYITPFEFQSHLIDPKLEVSLDVVANEDPFLTAYSNPSCIEIQSYINTDIRKRIESNLKTANKQLSGFVPGIVHLEMPFETQNIFSKTITSVYNRIFYNLNVHNNISAVVFHGFFYNRWRLGLEAGIQAHHEIVPSPNNHQEIPDSFNLIGAEDKYKSISQLGEEGTIIFAFELNSEQRTQAGRILFMASTPNGSRVVRIQFNELGNLIANIISVESGLKSYIFDEILLENNNKYVFTAVYNEECCAIRINSKEFIGRKVS